MLDDLLCQPSVCRHWSGHPRIGRECSLPREQEDRGCLHHRNGLPVERLRSGVRGRGWLRPARTVFGSHPMSVRRLAKEQPASFSFTPESLEKAQWWIAKFPPGRQQSAVIALLWLVRSEEHTS